MTTAIEDIPMTFARLKGLVRGLKKLIPNSPVILVEMEEQIENMKTLIRAKRDQINGDVTIWYNLNEWKTELMHQIDSSS